ncbi:thioesterase [Agaricicola taiwanensis]|uniref:Thioesterase n=1 Tax=Agaricicola taiwanensis TaxID=591372 RepID=A0A8J2YJ54_9RHOB|nr:PaaI family thioesterase [Agaricicola taiwanensis]GGE46142.1 thioesterase [Agaricicola taiwanensis]
MSRAIEKDDGLSGVEGATIDPAASGWEMVADDGFIALVGPVWQKRDENELIRYAFLAEAKHKNLRGVVQGGMIMTFADRAMGMTARQQNQNRPQATVQLDVHFVDAVRIGDFVEAHAQLVRKTRSLLFMRADLMVGSRVVATANGVWKTLERAEKPAGE